MRTRAQAFFTHNIVHNLALEGIHCIQAHRLAGLAHLVDRIKHFLANVLALAGKKAVHIKDEAGPLPRALLHGQAGELLQGIDDFAILANQMLDVGIVISHNLHHGAPIADAHLDVAFVVDDIQQSFQVIGRNISFIIELVDGLVLVFRHRDFSLLTHVIS